MYLSYVSEFESLLKKKHTKVNWSLKKNENYNANYVVYGHVW